MQLAMADDCSRLEFTTDAGVPPLGDGRVDVGRDGVHMRGR